MNPLEAPIGGLEEVRHIDGIEEALVELKRFELQTPEGQAWAARDAITKLEDVIVKLEDVIALLEPVADGEPPPG